MTEDAETVPPSLCRVCSQAFVNAEPGGFAVCPFCRSESNDAETVALRELAEAANRGPWTAVKPMGPWGSESSDEGGWTICVNYGTPLVKRVAWQSKKFDDTEANFRFIAAADPATVLALLDRIDELEARS